jgi:hypothetical protein
MPRIPYASTTQANVSPLALGASRCETRLSSQPPTVWVIFGCLKGCLDGRECDASALADLHVWLLFFTNDLALTLKSEVGLQQQLDMFQQFYAKRGLQFM